MTAYTLITGASEGLGVEFARIAANEGRNLILAARSQDKLDALAADLRSDSVDVVVIPADLSDMEQVDRLWAEASTGREIDVLVNNAGLGYNGAFSAGQGWDRELSSIHVNMLALTRLMKLAIPHMEALPKGRILNVASVAAFTPGPNMAVYHATKAYVLSLSEAVAEELRGTTVTVTALCPGATVQGEYGLFRRAEIEAEARAMSEQLAQVQADVAEMENLTQRLSDEYLDLDLLDAQARSVLGRLRSDEIVIR